MNKENMEETEAVIEDAARYVSRQRRRGSKNGTVVFVNEI